MKNSLPGLRYKMLVADSILRFLSKDTHDIGDGLRCTFPNLQNTFL